MKRRIKAVESVDELARKTEFQLFLSQVECLADFEAGTADHFYAKSEVYSFAISALRCMMESETNLQIFQRVIPEDRNYEIPKAVRIESGVEIELSDLSVISSIWEQSRFVTSIQSIFSYGFRRDWNSTNGRVFKELGLAVIDNGRHHIAAGRLYKEGSAKVDIYSLKEAFETVRTDGVRWYDSINAAASQPVPSSQFALIYELARRRATMLAGAARAERPVDTVEAIQAVTKPDIDAACWQLFDELDLARREIYILKKENELKAKMIQTLRARLPPEG